MSENELQFNYSGMDDYPTPLELSVVNKHEISTVKLPSSTYPEDSWETCIFYADDSEAAISANTDSEVLARYSTEIEARFGHRKIVDKFLEDVK